MVKPTKQTLPFDSDTRQTYEKFDMNMDETNDLPAKINEKNVPDFEMNIVEQSEMNEVNEPSGETSKNENNENEIINKSPPPPYEKM